MMKKYKIAIISPVPFYYHIPFYSSLADNESIDLTVIYCSKETLSGEDVKKRYQTDDRSFHADSLLSGYNSIFLKNFSPQPSFMNWPFGLMNFGVWRTIKKGNYDAVILQSWTNIVWWLAFLACLRFKTPLFFMTDSNILAEKAISRWKRVLKDNILGKFVFEKSAGFLTSGVANEMFYSYYGVPDKKMARVPFSWGYEKLLEVGAFLRPKRRVLREAFGLTENDFIVLYVGRLSQEKMPLSILEAYATINKPNKKLFMVGDGPMRKDFEQRIKEGNIQGVTMFGFQPHHKIPDFYTAADVLVLASRAETWGNCGYGSHVFWFAYYNL
jgi:glycosyltransferase involved in cell wall biosynthesis